MIQEPDQIMEIGGKFEIFAKIWHNIIGQRHGSGHRIERDIVVKALMTLDADLSVTKNEVWGWIPLPLVTGS